MLPSPGDPKGARTQTVLVQFLCILYFFPRYNYYFMYIIIPSRGAGVCEFFFCRIMCIINIISRLVKLGWGFKYASC